MTYPIQVIFDESNQNFCLTTELATLYLQCQEVYVNHLLEQRGHVFLNEIFDFLGLPRTPEGQLSGWIFNEDGPTKISFGVDFDAVDMNSRSITLTLAHEGHIWHTL